MDVLDIGDAIYDVELARERLVRRFSGAEITTARERPSLDSPEQVLDIESRDRTLAAEQFRCSVERLGQFVDAGAPALDSKCQVALAFEAPQAEQLAETLIEVDVRELHLRLKGGAGGRFGNSHAALDHPAKRLGFPDGDRKVAALQRDGNSGPSELRTPQSDPRRR